MGVEQETCPGIVEVSTQDIGALALDESSLGSASSTNTSLKSDQDEENLSELISSYLTATDSGLPQVSLE